MFDQSIRIIARLGDRDPLNDGGVILDHGDGRPTLIWLTDADSDSVDEYGDPTHYLEFRCDILDIDDAVNGPGNQWVDVQGVSSCCDIPEAELKRLAAGTVQEQAMALWIAAGYHGWEEFDSYPQRLTKEEAEEFSAAIDECESRPARTMEA